MQEFPPLTRSLPFSAATCWSREGQHTSRRWETPGVGTMCTHECHNGTTPLNCTQVAAQWVVECQDLEEKEAAWRAAEAAAAEAAVQRQADIQAEKQRLFAKCATVLIWGTLDGSMIRRSDSNGSQAWLRCREHCVDFSSRHGNDVIDKNVVSLQQRMDAGGTGMSQC